MSQGVAPEMIIEAGESRLGVDVRRGRTVRIGDKEPERKQ